MNPLPHSTLSSLMYRVPSMAHILLLSFLVLTVSASHAALEAEVYWHKVLPNTPMPSAIKDLLSPDVYSDEKPGTSVTVGKGGVNVNTGNGKPGGTTVNVGHGGVGVNVHGGRPNTHVGVGRGGVGVNVGGGHGNPKAGNSNGHKGVGVNVGHGGVGVNVGGGKGKPGKKPVVVNVSPFIYKYAATETQIHDDPHVALFFLEKDLHPGAKMTLRFAETTSGGGGAFLPRRTADSFPFSSSKLPEILAHFSVEPDSTEAEAMKRTLGECEEPAVAGESKRCTTSLESMVEFSTASLGTRDVEAASTAVEGEGSAAEQEYTIAPSGVKRMGGSSSLGSRLVACHAEAYPYAVFYCHASSGAARAYRVGMVGKDGARVVAVAVCHTDTAAWNPKHLAFRVLKVKPGTVPICHFLPQDHVVWTPNK